MKTIQATQQELLNPKLKKWERLILEFLLDKAIGRANAKTWDAISRKLVGAGWDIRKNSFQNGLLKRSRESDFFIGSTDAKPSGYFIIDTLKDAQEMERWYLHRITTETARLNHLHSLMFNSINKKTK